MIFTFGRINCDLLLKLYWSACLKGKRSFKISTTTTTNKNNNTNKLSNKNYMDIFTVTSLLNKKKLPKITILIMHIRANYFCRKVTQTPGELMLAFM